MMDLSALVILFAELATFGQAGDFCSCTAQRAQWHGPHMIVGELFPVEAGPIEFVHDGPVPICCGPLTLV